MSKVYLTLHPSERAVATAAAQIYSAYIAAGRVSEGTQSDWMQRSVQEAIEIAKIADQSITSDGEMG